MNGRPECREVCQICYRSSSHKPTPTLTPEAKRTYDASSKRTKCLVCRQAWTTLKVAKDNAYSKWIEIRPRPKIPANIDYQLCKSYQSKCAKGQECSFAHCKYELALWNADRQQEPRPAPAITGPYQYQMCKHKTNTGNCPYGQRCTFAHSEEELKIWLKAQASFETSGRFNTGPSSNPGMELKCDTCGLTCTSARQLEDHLAGSKHRQMLQSKPGYPSHPSPRTTSNHFRRRPFLSFPINGYKICKHIMAGRRCVHGEFCTFAHNQMELDEWNKQLQMDSQARHTQRRQQVPGNSQPPQPPQTSTGLDEFEEDPPNQTQDFDVIIRNKLLSEHNRKQNLSELEKNMEGVTISEISGRPLCLQWSQAAPVDWTFEIATNTLRILQSVILFDSFLTDFTITGSVLVWKSQTRLLTSIANPEKGSGLLFKQRLNPNERIRIKVTLVPRSGVLSQLIVFDFGTFQMIRGLAVHVLTDHEIKLLDESALSRKKNKPKPNLFWEQHHKVMPMDAFLEETDKSLPEYALPEQVERFIEGGKYKNVEAHVTSDNYRKRMHNLLYLEEYQQRETMSRYDLYDIMMNVESTFNTPVGAQFPPPGFAFVKVQLEETVFEGGRSVRPNDNALMHPANQPVAFECVVEHVAKDFIILKISDVAKQTCESVGGRFSLRISLGRLHMKSMHYAVDTLDMSVIFPASSEGVVSMSRSPHINECIAELKTLGLNKNQEDSIMSMLDPSCTRIPSLVLGPFGCGKTRTMSECIKLLTRLVPESRTLICTHSNSAANLYVEALDREWRERYNTRAPLLRVYYTGRMISSITQTVRQYCKFDKKGQLALPSLADLQTKIVVTTLSTSRTLSLAKIPKGHFTHIFIDEAAQALEPECIIPLCLAGPNTKVVLAGDHMQMDPPVHSPIARKYGLHISLLERLFDHGVYDSGVGTLCKTLLTENHRSHQQILELPSKLFYRNKLSCKAVFPPTGPKDFPPIKFVGVSGRECQNEDSPSYYNEQEVEKIAYQVELLVRGGLEQSEICVLSYYKAQVFRIRYALRKHRLGKVEVVRVDDVQGKEFRALLLSTVRTCSTEPPDEEEAGFLTNPKMFNTAVTRAKEWLVVVGEPFTLCTVGENRLCWMEYIRCCQKIGSFDFTSADQFVEESLDYKIVVRQLLQNTHKSFFAPNNGQTTPPPLTPSTFAQATPQHQMEILLSKVKEAAHNGSNVTVRKITEELLKMKIEEQASLVAKPELFAAKVREVEQVFRRAGPTAAIINSNRMEAPLTTPTSSQPQPRPQLPVYNGMQMGQVPVPVPVPMNGPASDLPIHLQKSMESVVMYARWMESLLHQPVATSPGVRENLLSQQANVKQQLKLINDLIFMFRDLSKMIQFHPHPMMFAQGNPRQFTMPPRPQQPGPQVMPTQHPPVRRDSPFSFGVSAQLPNNDPQAHNKPQFVAGIVKGGRSTNPGSSLDAAVTNSTHQQQDQELYVSDDEEL